MIFKIATIFLLSMVVFGQSDANVVVAQKAASTLLIPRIFESVVECAVEENAATANATVLDILGDADISNSLFSDDNKSKCFLMCMIARAGIFKDNAINDDLIKTVYAIGRKRDMLPVVDEKKINKVLNDCKASNRNINDCDKREKALECIYNMTKIVFEDIDELKTNEV